MSHASHPALGRRPKKVFRPGFLTQDSGTVTIFAVIGFAMVMIIVGLVLDVGRVMNVHSQASSYADRVALTAAAELDGRTSALARAVNAARGENAQVDNGFRLTLSGDNTVEVERIVFMSTLSDDPADPFARSPLPGDVVVGSWSRTAPNTINPVDPVQRAIADRRAAYVLIETTEEKERFLFFPLLGDLVPMPEEATVAPQAVAGFNRRVCNSAPIMMCNINEAPSLAGTGAAFTYDRTRMIRSRLKTVGTNWEPGMIALLPHPGSNVRNDMARVDPNTSCAGGRVTPFSAGNTELDQFRDGINTRFDMYDASTYAVRNTEQYAPAPNVNKGFGFNREPNSCSIYKSSGSTPMGRDRCFMPGGVWPEGQPGGGSNCAWSGFRTGYGRGDWHRGDAVRRNDGDPALGYWNYNHWNDGPNPNDDADDPGPDPLPPGYATMSRYDLYRWELENAPTGLPWWTQETAAPRCANNAAPVEDQYRDRRVLPVAIVNCMANLARLNDGQSVPVEGYAEVFLTEPMSASSSSLRWWDARDADLYLEVIGVVRPGLQASTLREYPVLYR